MAKDCPDKHMRNTQQTTSLCLRCGEMGHDMFACANDYPPDDVKVGYFCLYCSLKFVILLLQMNVCMLGGLPVGKYKEKIAAPLGLLNNK